ncbi:PIG-L deacetylase family protein [Euzebya rosea]|uniref:PIG-L deacetylase family protein n=1 Tax=Euzebya rosea TaxID=2052804 RepID=UPI00130075AD|nr:PIG-L deacetylase family protein [Euzebya rosea]
MTGWALHRDAAPTWDPPEGPVVVVAPHPDDETLGAGGLLALTRDRATVLAVTDGGSAYPGHVDHDVLAARRREEQRSALATLGVDPDRLHRLGITDGAVPAHEDEVTEAILDLTPEGATVVAPWIHDHHSDHIACGRAAVRAVALRPDLDLRAWLFWAYHHTAVERLAPDTLVALDLDEDVRRRKERAIDAHASQLTGPHGVAPILDRDLLGPALTSRECFVTRSDR